LFPHGAWSRGRAGAGADREAIATNVPVLIDPPPVGHVTPVSSVTIRPQLAASSAR